MAKRLREESIESAELNEWEWQLLQTGVLSLSCHCHEYAIPRELFHYMVHLLRRLLYQRSVQLTIHAGPRRYGDRLWSGILCVDFSCKFFDARCALNLFAVEKAAGCGARVKVSPSRSTLRYLLASFAGGEEAPLKGEADWANCVKHVNWAGHTGRTVSLYYEFPYY